jgi:hypothetical protein
MQNRFSPSMSKLFVERRPNYTRCKLLCVPLTELLTLWLPAAAVAAAVVEAEAARGSGEVVVVAAVVELLPMPRFSARRVLVHAQLVSHDRGGLQSYDREGPRNMGNSKAQWTLPSPMLAPRPGQMMQVVSALIPPGPPGGGG